MWLNGRAAVSKTEGCGFKSCHPCDFNIDKKNECVL